MADCPICAENFNCSTRKKCTCPYCKIDYCRKCVGTWLTSLVNEPHCPNDTCKKLWNREYLDTIMTKVWRNTTYCQYRENLLFDREKALLPATQPRIEAINEANRIEREIISPMRDRRNLIRIEIAKLNMEDETLRRQIWDFSEQAIRLREGLGIDETKKRATFIRRCPSEGCRGFLSSAWKCGVCELFSCSECHEVKGATRDSPHTCDPGNVETAKLLAKDTKACPKCGEMITKIDGCDQMWCISCHSAFSWRTGQIISGIVHNPHYYEWQRKQNNGEAPRNIGDIPCGGLLDWADIRRPIQNIIGRPFYPGWLAILELAHRRINHIQNVEILTLNRDGININDNIDLRIKYLLNDIDDDEIKSQLQTREKKNEKERELRRIYETLIAAATDIFRRLSMKEKINTVENEESLIENTDKKLETFTKKYKKESDTFQQLFINELSELNELRLFINESLDILRKRYNCSIRGFDENWERISLKKQNQSEEEIKTPYGHFNELIVQIHDDFASIQPILNNENAQQKYKYIDLKIRKARKKADDLPQNSSNNTKTLAINVVMHFDYKYKAFIFSGGTGEHRGHAIFYTTRTNNTADHYDKWQQKIKEIDLVVKPLNTIE